MAPRTRRALDTVRRSLRRARNALERLGGNLLGGIRELGPPLRRWASRPHNATAGLVLAALAVVLILLVARYFSSSESYEIDASTEYVQVESLGEQVWFLGPGVLLHREVETNSGNFEVGFQPLCDHDQSSFDETRLTIRAGATAALRQLSGGPLELSVDARGAEDRAIRLENPGCRPEELEGPNATTNLILLVPQPRTEDPVPKAIDSAGRPLSVEARLGRLALYFDGHHLQLGDGPTGAPDWRHQLLDADVRLLRGWRSSRLAHEIKTLELPAGDVVQACGRVAGLVRFTGDGPLRVVARVSDPGPSTWAAVRESAGGGSPCRDGEKARSLVRVERPGALFAYPRPTPVEYLLNDPVAQALATAVVSLLSALLISVRSRIFGSADTEGR